MMKGFIIKDLLGLKQIALTIGALMVFYLAMGMMQPGDGGGSFNCFSVMAVVVNIMVPLTCAGYDEQCEWDSFGAALPIGRNKIVAARYLVDLIVMGFTTFAVFVSNMIYGLLGGHYGGAISYLMPIVVSAVYISVMTPIIYKFGVQKSRFLLIAICMLPMLIASAVIIAMTSSGSEVIDLFVSAVESVGGHLTVAAIVSLGFAALLFVLSMLLSMRIYRKKAL